MCRTATITGAKTRKRRRNTTKSSMATAFQPGRLCGKLRLSCIERHGPNIDDRYGRVRQEIIDMPVIPFCAPKMARKSCAESTTTKRAPGIDQIARLELEYAQFPDRNLGRDGAGQNQPVDSAFGGDLLRVGAVARKACFQEKIGGV